MVLAPFLAVPESPAQASQQYHRALAQLQSELTETENKIGFTRQFYNDTATRYNTAQQTFPTMLFAGMAGASPATLWEISNEAERYVPKVDLTMGIPVPPNMAALPNQSPVKNPEQ